MIISGKVLSLFINPLMWISTISYFTFRIYLGNFIESFYPTNIFYLAIFSLMIGNFLYIYYHLLGCANRGNGEILKYLFFMPFYWLFMSIAAWQAVYSFLVNPFYWEKTQHGFYVNKSFNLAPVEVVDL